MSPSMTAVQCPGCSAPGKAVRAITLDALLTPAALAGIRGSDGWRHCPAAECATAYFQPESGDRLATSDVRVRVGTKETAAPRPLCYCFGHTAEDIEAEVARTGASTIADTITEQCRRGFGRCAETNPQGSCCLGNVRAAERRALQGQAVPVEDCCASSTACGGGGGTWASLGAMGSAVLSSACCWLPLLLLAFGVSAGGVASFLDAYRPWLLASAGLFLAVAFAMTYRKTSGAPSRLATLNRVLLWTSTVVVIAFAALPSYVGRIVGNRAVGSNEPTVGADCCAGHPGTPGKE